MSESVIDVDLRWTVYMDVGGNEEAVLPLFQVTQDMFVEPEFSDKIRQLLLENPHYLPGANVTRIVTPEMHNVVNKALFLMICFLKEYAEDMTGGLNHYLFGEMRDQRFRLVAAADKELTNERFKFFMRVVTRKPELVKNLVLTHHCD